MKKTKFLLSLLVVLSMLFVVGCGCRNQTNNYIPDEPDTTETNQAPETPTPPPTTGSDNVAFTIVPASDDMLSDYPSHIEFIEDAEEPKIAILTDIPKRDFRWIEIDVDTVNDNFVFSEGRVLYSTPELLPNTPFVVTWLERGTLPHRGISFVDGTNTRRYFTISNNHADNGGRFIISEFGRD